MPHKPNTPAEKIDLLQDQLSALKAELKDDDEAKAKMLAAEKKIRIETQAENEALKLKITKAESLSAEQSVVNKNIKEELEEIKRENSRLKDSNRVLERFNSILDASNTQLDRSVVFPLQHKLYDSEKEAEKAKTELKEVLKEKEIRDAKVTKKIQDNTITIDALKDEILKLKAKISADALDRYPPSAERASNKAARTLSLPPLVMSPQARGGKQPWALDAGNKRDRPHDETEDQTQARGNKPKNSN